MTYVMRLLLHPSVVRRWKTYDIRFIDTSFSFLSKQPQWHLLILAMFCQNVIIDRQNTILCNHAENDTRFKKGMNALM